MQQLIRSDGGSGEYIEDTSTGMLGVFDALVSKKADATWVFMGWEGVIAKRKGVTLTSFSLHDYKVWLWPLCNCALATCCCG